MSFYICLPRLRNLEHERRLPRGRCVRAERRSTIHGMSTPGPAPDDAPAKPYRYFISHASEDLALAMRVREGLQSFNKSWKSFRATTVYLDETNLPANADIRASIEVALRNSEYFVLLASPAAANSPWVRREIEAFLESNAADRLIIVLASGSLVWLNGLQGVDWERTTALPRDLPARTFAREPKYVDLSWAADAQRLDTANPRFRAEIARLVAGSSGQSLDHLISEDVQKFRAFRRRHMLGNAVRAGLAFGCAPLFYLLAPDVALSLRSFPAVLTARHAWAAPLYDMANYQPYFPFGEALLALGFVAALAAGAGVRGAIGFALGYFLLAPLHTFSALRTYGDDPFERLIVCLASAVSFVVAGALGGAFSKRISWRAAALTFGAGGVIAAVLRFEYPAVREWTHFPLLSTELPFAVLRGPWTPDRLRIAVASLRPDDLFALWFSFSFQFPLVVAGCVSGLLLGWRMGVADMPDFTPRPARRRWIRGSWFALSALLVCLSGIVVAAVTINGRRQLAAARAEFLDLAGTRLMEASCNGEYDVRNFRLVLEVRDILRRSGPADLSKRLERHAKECENVWALIQPHDWDFAWETVTPALPDPEMRALLADTRHELGAGERAERLPDLAKAWRRLGDSAGEKQIVQEMKEAARGLPLKPLGLRVRYAEAFWRGGEMDAARAVIAPVVREPKGGQAPHFVNEVLNQVDGITLWRTGIWQTLPAWRERLDVHLGVLAAMAADRAQPEQIRQVCTAQSVSGEKLARFGLELAMDGSFKEANGALDVIEICSVPLNERGALPDSFGVASTLALALQNAVAAQDSAGVKAYAARIHRVVEANREEDGRFRDEVGTPAACALAAAGETGAALEIAIKVHYGTPEPAPDAILCVAQAERLAGRKDRALADLRLAWTSISHDSRYNPITERQRKGVGLELARLGETVSARTLARECDEPLDRLKVLAAILEQSR